MKLLKNYIIQRYQCKRFRRNVTTWSPLATAFNARPQIKHQSNNEHQTGLFNKPELATHEGFQHLKEEAIEISNRLIKEATSDPSRPMVDIFDELSNTLCKVADLAEFVRVAHPNPQFAYAAEDACISISGVVEKLNTHKGLYLALCDSVKRNTSGNKHLAELFIYDFEQSGIQLDDGPRSRVVELNDLILQTGQQFMAGASKPRRIKRSGLPQNVRHLFANEGNYITVNGLFGDCEDAIAREVAYRLFLSPDKDQESLLTTTLEARKELAQLCGFNCYAERATGASAMNTAANVNQFLNTLSENIHNRAKIDFEAMLKMKKYDTPYLNTLSCWDTPYYTNKGKTQLLNVSRSEFSPYFSLGDCMEGLNMLCQELYGITLTAEEMLPGESWSPDVLKLAVVDSKTGLLGHIYCDFYDRPGKNQDCHFTIQAGKRLADGSYQNPIVVVMLSVCNKHGDGPVLLSSASVDNLFHEMGHGLHSMMGRPDYQHISGTRCATDLAEVPSILMEYFATSPKVLRRFARHYETREPIPEDMAHRLSASKQLFVASEMQLQVFYSALDQHYHGPDASLDGNTTEVLKNVQKQYYGLPYVENTAWQHRFSHLIGYGAKYYAYLISRGISWSIWQRRFSDDPLNRSQGQAFRDGVLAHGGGLHPQILLKNYLGTDVTPESLASALTEELDHHRDHIDRVLKITH